MLKCVNCNMLINLIKKIKVLKNNQNLDARFWVQKLLYCKKTLKIIFGITNISTAPVAQLDRALGYGPGGSRFNS